MEHPEFSVEALEGVDGNVLYHTLKGLKAVDHERLVRGMMYITGVRQIDIARKYNIDKTVLSKVLSGKRKNRRVREAIAAELNVPFSMLWQEGQAPHEE